MENLTGARKPWLRFYDEGVPATIDYPEIRLDQLLADSAAKHPEQQAIIFGARVGSRILDSALSYQQLDETVGQLAGSLQHLDVGPGDRVAIIMPNCPQFVIAYFAILRAGGIAVPCNFLYSASELEHQLADAGAEVAIVLSPYYGRVHSIRRGAGLRHVIVTNIKEYFPSLLRLLFTLTKEKKGGHRTSLASPDLGLTRRCRCVFWSTTGCSTREWAMRSFVRVAVDDL